ncbi:MAG TPA: hypothetical protein VHV55_22890 [Pirellulales bacterium]|jgi:hypothetical protein|nr:hypothetical protein [Pirellulales bacterium]
MEKRWGVERYWTSYFADDKAGCAGQRLHRERFGVTAIAAEVVYWDAAGEFVAKTIDGDVPVEIAEAVFAEARQAIKLR